jgi:hypothetical protein
MESLKDRIRKTSEGGTIEIPFGGEFQEKLVIDKSIRIRSDKKIATIVGNSPTIKVQKEGVVLENLHIESCDETGICLSIKKGVSATFNNVSIKGSVEGLDKEDGEWEIPDTLELVLEPNTPSTKKMIIHCPVEAIIYSSDMVGVQCSPHRLISGLNEIRVHIDEIHENTIIAGDLIIESAKYGLKRKISLTGNTFGHRSAVAKPCDEYLWVCDSAGHPIKSDFLKRLPSGEQDVPYCFVLDQKSLESKGYGIRVKGLPKGIRCHEIKSVVKIEGMTDSFGEFELTFIFRKNGLSFEFPSKLEIAERKIVPLKIKPLPDPIEAEEQETINYKIGLISSNSPIISFRLKKKLPNQLNLDSSTGVIKGAVLYHGIYHSLIKITDGANVVESPITFMIKPKAPIKFNLKELYTFNKYEEFKVPIDISGAESLAPKIVLAEGSSTRIKLKLRNNKYFLEGKLNDSKDYFVKLEVRDKYNRQFQKTIVVKCIEEPNYRVTWFPDSPTVKKGRMSDDFNIQIRAAIVEDSNLKPGYRALGTLPPNYNLKEDGTLHGKIDGKTHYINVRAEKGHWHDDTELEIITIVDDSRFVNGSKISAIFKEKSKKNNQYPSPTNSDRCKEKNQNYSSIGDLWNRPGKNDTLKNTNKNNEPSKSKQKLGKAFNWKRDDER